jgi:hypothetical protein
MRGDPRWREQIARRIQLGRPGTDSLTQHVRGEVIANAFVSAAGRGRRTVLESARLRNNFRSGILAPQRRLRKRCKRLTPMQISGRGMRRRYAFTVPRGRQNPAHSVASVDTDDDCSGSSRGWACSSLDAWPPARPDITRWSVECRSASMAIVPDSGGAIVKLQFSGGATADRNTTG